jgi:DNA ligase-1
MLAQKYDPDRTSPAGWFVSKKLDGIRMLWDGGCSTGMLKSDVPWANTDKDERYVEPERATGLWSRYGNVVHAPQWFLDELPEGVMLDGECWAPYMSRQTIRSAMSKLIPVDMEWYGLQYRVFDMPSVDAFTEDGMISGPNFKKQMIQSDLLEWICHHSCLPIKSRSRPFRSVPGLLATILNPIACPHIIPHPQRQLPFSTADANKVIDALMIEALDEAYGEGLILRAPESHWLALRSWGMLKVKGVDDDEGIVIGYTTGRATDKGSRLLGMIGALVIKWNDVVFELSGLSDLEREFSEFYVKEWAIENPGCRIPADKLIKDISDVFPIGTEVTFQYRGLTDAGVPNEARYWRKR